MLTFAHNSVLKSCLTTLENTSTVISSEILLVKHFGLHDAGGKPMMWHTSSESVTLVWDGTLSSPMLSLFPPFKYFVVDRPLYS